MNNIFYIIGVIVVVLFIAGYFGLRQPRCPQDDSFVHLKAIAVDKDGQASLKIENAVQAACGCIDFILSPEEIAK